MTAHAAACHIVLQNRKTGRWGALHTNHPDDMILDGTESYQWIGCAGQAQPGPGRPDEAACASKFTAVGNALSFHLG